MASILQAVGNIVAYLVGGTVTPSTGDPVTITLANSWVGQFATCITSNPILLIFALTGLVFLGLNSVRKLMNV